MISSIFLDISLLFSCCCFTFLFSFFFHFRFSNLFSHSSVFFFVFFLHIFPHFCCFNFHPVFLSLALFDLSLPSPCSSSSSVSSSISTSSFFFSPLFLFFLFSFFFLPLLFSSYPSVTISSIFLVISWERCSPLPHFIHPCWHLQQRFFEWI